MSKFITWFIMVMYGAPTTAILIIDALQGFVRIKAQPVGTLFIIGVGFLVVLFGAWILRDDKKEDIKRELLKQRLGGRITTLTFGFEDGSRLAWYVPVNKLQEVYKTIQDLHLIILNMKTFKLYLRCVYHTWFNWKQFPITILFILLPLLLAIRNHAIYHAWWAFILMFLLIPFIVFADVQFRLHLLDQKPKNDLKNELLALAASWEETGKHSISNRIRETMNFCAKELKDLLNNKNIDWGHEKKTF